MMYLLTLILSLNIAINVSAQDFDERMLNDKLLFSEVLLNKQPTKDELSGFLHEKFTLDSIGEFKYYFKDKRNNQIVAHLHIESLNIVYIEFYEFQDNLKLLHNFLTGEKGFEYWGSQHNCDYLNDKKISLTLCPGMEKGIMVHVGLYKM